MPTSLGGPALFLNLEPSIAAGVGAVGTVAHITRAWGGRFALQGIGGVIVPRNGKEKAGFRRVADAEAACLAWHEKYPESDTYGGA